MPVTLISAPDPLAFSRGGRTTFHFLGSGQYLTRGATARGVLRFSGPLADGTRIQLRWRGQNQTITFRNNPQLPNEAPAGDGSADYARDVLAPFFQEYFPFREDFVATASDFGSHRGIVFNARQHGEAYTLSLVAPPTPTAPAQLGFEPILAGADPIRRDRYGVYVELWALRPGSAGDSPADFDRVFSAPVETNETGECQFDAGSVLHSLLTPDWPTWSFQNPSGSVYSVRKYFLAYGEAWGSPLQIGRMQADDIRTVYLGGADFAGRAGSGFELYKFTGSTPALDTALRFGSLTRYIRPDEPQYLTFVNTRPQQDQSRLTVELTFDDGSSLSRDNLLPTQLALPKGEKLTYPVGPRQLELLALVPAGKHLTEYSVRRTAGNGSALSVTYRYVLNYDYQPYTRYFAYLTSLGVVDTLATTGKGSAELTRFYEQAERYLPHAYTVQDGQFVDYNVGLQQQVEVTTGFRPAAELLLWTDFYRSAYRFRLQTGRALPIGILSKSIKQGKDGDTLFAHTFEYTYLFRDDFFTAEAEEEAGDGAPPIGFVAGGGTVVVEQTTLIRSVDDTVPNAVRGLTPERINTFDIAAARPDPRTLGFLNEQTARMIFRPSSIPIQFAELQNIPNTRDGIGLSDVPTLDEVRALAESTLTNNDVVIRVKTWITALEPA
ncbi:MULTISPECIES: hypothetical protein [Spirosoma]|uniref:Uncharacterized protein n=1 Tax=Spirosoma sordidisoli TaxID=2502893 RepID=A0A4Q2UPW0_9BACT|nr:MULTISPECIES: hypothetical protein [Spirosoma]RYC69821.1 hypothetical protein EQG79_14605 [Spirosoma sordidisoli]